MIWRNGETNRRVSPYRIQWHIDDDRSGSSVRISRVVILVDTVIINVYRRTPRIKFLVATVSCQILRGAVFLEVDWRYVRGRDGRRKGRV